MDLRDRRLRVLRDGDRRRLCAVLRRPVRQPRHPDRRHLPLVPAEARHARGRVPHPHARLGHRHDGAGVGHLAGHGLSRPRAAVDRALHLVRVCSRREPVAGGGSEVSPGRRFRERVRAVWDGPRVWRVRHDADPQDRDGPRQLRVEQPALDPRHRADGRRLCFQGLGGAVPHVDAGCVSGRADTGHRIHVGGNQGGRVRHDHPRLRGWAPPPRARVAGAARLRRGHEHGRRQSDGHRPVELEAPARLLWCRPGRLRPHRRDRRRQGRVGRGPVLPVHLHVHELRRVRDRDAAGRS